MDVFIFLQIFLSSILATLAMKIFSYFMPENFQKLYRQPFLVTYLLQKLNFRISAFGKILLGWLLHFIIGFVFVFVYHTIWYNSILILRWESGILLGAICGIIGIASWICIFKFINYQAKFDYSRYYLQLFAAHITFGIVAFATYSYL
ncbi:MULTISPECIES: hypothetical protein [unclassified Flavobacterium]|uniref:hypothetical protein n=1 Tax=unclassified Flavobacterium TaxID=196869 RepID=UPI003F8E12CD